MSTSPVTREIGNMFVAALNARVLCACATIRTLTELGVPGPYLPCDLHPDGGGS